jgi:cytidylate kinase
MTAPVNLDRCRTFIDCQLTPAGVAPAPIARPLKLAVTISRQTGSGAWLVAEKLAQFLDQQAPAEGCRWTVFDRELVERVLEDHHLPRKLAAFMPEDRVSGVQDMVQEILGLHPPSWTLARQATETILRLGEIGHVILIGRGANVITAKLPHVFHVRLVGSLERRIARIQELLKIERKAAVEFIERADRGRQRYLKEHFEANIDDPLAYDLVLNTDRLACENAALLIGQAALMRRASATSG